MSGSQVPYHLRVNKYIDRELLVESLQLVNRCFPLQPYGYVSMAGPYLEDCRVIHQATGISRMYSFDNDSLVLARQQVNCPFGFIQRHQRSSKQVVQDFQEVRQSLGNDDISVLLWLDYTNPAQRLAQLQEVEALVPHLRSGDIVRVTMNAHRQTLGENKDYIHLPDSVKPPTLQDWRYQQLKGQLGGYLPSACDASEHVSTKAGLCRTIIRALKQVVVRALEPRNELVAFPLLSTAYEDQHTLATVAWLILETEKAGEFRIRARWEEWTYKPGEEWDEFADIQVPHLSLRERHAIHQCMTQADSFSGEQLVFLTTEDLAQYRAHYLRYPTFAPLDVL